MYTLSQYLTNSTSISGGSRKLEGGLAVVCALLTLFLHQVWDNMWELNNACIVVGASHIVLSVLPLYQPGSATEHNQMPVHLTQWVSISRHCCTILQAISLLFVGVLVGVSHYHSKYVPVAILAESVNGPTTIKFALTGGFPGWSLSKGKPIVSSTWMKWQSMRDIHISLYTKLSILPSPPIPSLFSLLLSHSFPPYHTNSLCSSCQF